MEPQRQTLRRAKAAFKATGPQLSARELAQHERNAVLEERAGRIREAEKRRKALAVQKAAREKREREIRAAQGVGVATQLAGFSHTQRGMKRGMEGWIRLGRKEGSKGDGENTFQGEEEDRDDDDDDIFAAIETEGAHSTAKHDQIVEEEEEDQDEIFVGIETEGVDSTVKQKDSAQETDPWDEDELDEESLLGIADAPRDLPGTAKTARYTEEVLQIASPKRQRVAGSQEEKVNRVLYPSLDNVTAKNDNGKRTRDTMTAQPRASRVPSKKLPIHVPEPCGRQRQSTDTVHKNPLSKTIPQITRSTTKRSGRKEMLDRAMNKYKSLNRTDWKPPNARTGGVPFIKASVYQTIPQRDEWDDFLDSSTQISRELSGPKQIAKPVEVPLDVFICTQDLNLSQEDLEELGMPRETSISKPQALIAQKIFTAPRAPAKKPPLGPGNSLACPAARTKPPPLSSSMRPPILNSKMLPPPRPPPQPPLEIPEVQAMPKMQAGRPAAVEEDFGFSTQDIRAIIDDEITLSPD